VPVGDRGRDREQAHRDREERDVADAQQERARADESEPEQIAARRRARGPSARRFDPPTERGARALGQLVRRLEQERRELRSRRRVLRIERERERELPRRLRTTVWPAGVERRVRTSNVAKRELLSALEVAVAFEELLDPIREPPRRVQTLRGVDVRRLDAERLELGRHVAIGETPRDARVDTLDGLGDALA